MRNFVRKVLALALLPLRPILGRKLRRKVTKLLNRNEKLYIPPHLGVAGFFRALDKANARHIVLRWFEDLPQVERGHDLDILVSDDAIDAVRGLLWDWPLGQKIDFYSETGQRGTGFKPSRLTDVPAFPPAIASQMLNGARRQAGGWCVPDRRSHFLGLAYHAVYLKGFDSGLPPDPNIPPHKKGSRDYVSVLGGLETGAGIKIARPITMESIDEMLTAQGWRPDDDHLKALAPVNRWIKVSH